MSWLCCTCFLVRLRTFQPTFVLAKHFNHHVNSIAFLQTPLSHPAPPIDSYSSIYIPKYANITVKSAIKMFDKILNITSRMNTSTPYFKNSQKNPRFVTICEKLFSEYWLVGCFELNGPLRQYCSLYRIVSQREGAVGWFAGAG